MNKKFIYLIIFISYSIILLLLTSCGKSINCCIIKLPPLTFTSERTSLEKQILGTYKEIRDDVWIVSSAQTVEGLKISSTTNTNRAQELNIDFKVIKALETIEYDKEKVISYKTNLLIGENNEGFLSYRENSIIEKNPEMKKKLLEILSEVNDARLVLMLEVINRNPNFTLDDLPSVKQTFRELNQQETRPGEWIQLKNNEWIKKK